MTGATTGWATAPRACARTPRSSSPFRSRANVSLLDDPLARTVTVRRAIATTLNSPALDEQIMLDGRQPSLEAQAAGAIVDHAQGVPPSAAAAHAIAEFQKSNAFFTSPEVRRFALEERPGARTAAGTDGIREARPPVLRGRAAGSHRRFQAWPLLALPQRTAAEQDEPVRAGLHRAADPGRSTLQQRRRVGVQCGREHGP